MEKQNLKEPLTMEALKHEPWWNKEMHKDSEYLDAIEEQIERHAVSLPRGYRNNNPGNIRKGKTQWVGLCRRQKDKEFCQFKSLAMGFRAMLKTLRSYYESKHLRSLLALITRWAPTADGNDPLAYANRVSAQVARTIKEPLPHPQGDKILWVDILLAMAEVENGTNRYYPKGYLRACANEAWRGVFDV